MWRKILFSFLILILSFISVAHGASRSGSSSSGGGSRLTYDVGVSTGSYGGKSYSEANLGLNWYMADWMAWRNAVFSRFGSGESASGLDTSLRFEYKTAGDDFGVRAFAGPGYRFSSKTLSAAFAEAGLILKLGGLSVGAGAKAMQYTSPGDDSTGKALPKNDTTYFLILGGGGVL